MKLLLRGIISLSRVFRNPSRYFLKSFSPLALDVRVLRDDQTEVEIMESVDYGETDLRAVIEGRFQGTSEMMNPLQNMATPNRNSTVMSLLM